MQSWSEQLAPLRASEPIELRTKHVRMMACCLLELGFQIDHSLAQLRRFASRGLMRVLPSERFVNLLHQGFCPTNGVVSISFQFFHFRFHAVQHTVCIARLGVMPEKYFRLTVSREWANEFPSDGVSIPRTAQMAQSGGKPLSFTIICEKYVRASATGFAEPARQHRPIQT